MYYYFRSTKKKDPRVSKACNYFLKLRFRIITTCFKKDEGVLFSVERKQIYKKTVYGISFPSPTTPPVPHPFTASFHIFRISDPKPRQPPLF